TVKGDVHDIGKNLVDIIFTNNGYEVHNLGIKVAISDILRKASEINADAIGMSGLLVKSTLIMRENLLEMNERKHADTPVILGGAALTRTYVERDLRSQYEGRLFYGKDAFEGLHTMDRLMELRRGGVDDPDFGRVLEGREGAKPRAAAAAAAATAPTGDSAAGPAADLPVRAPSVVADNPIFPPPFLGTRVERGIPLDQIAGFVNETGLFRNQWGYRPDKAINEKDPEFKTRIRAIFREQLAEARKSNVLQPALVYGYFAVNSDGNDLIVWKDDSRTGEWLRFSFPRQPADPFLSIADFYRSVDSGEPDYTAMHVVTMGAAVSKEAARLFAADRYQDYLHLHGLGVEMTEALAELWHKRIRTDWGFVDEDGDSLGGLFRQKYRGGRYSWGYEACPNLEDNAKCAELLGAERVGVEVSEESSWQFHPEQTTAAIICHHPQAKYFVVR
ncbi:MAG: cobalamin-dependent protein, partial [Actinomycetota bacterium]|nr:cobalamin-dependent protein [Actinomycetota bacterium]